MSELKYWLKLFIKPKSFFQHQSIDGKQFYYNVMKFLMRTEVKNRKIALRDLESIKIKPIPEEVGYRKLDDISQPIMENAILRAKEIIDETDFAKLQAESEKKYLVSRPINIFEDKNKAIRNFVLNPELVKAVGDYLGMMPVIENVVLLYSPNDTNETNSSQLFHLDAQDLRTVQIFLYLSDVDEQCGPFTVLDSTLSEKVIRETGYKKRGKFKRIEDEDLFKLVPKQSVVPFIAKSGTAMIVDTDRCLHYGSRKGVKPRYVLVTQFYSPFAFPLPFDYRKGLPFYNEAIKNIKSLNTMEKYLLGVNE